MRFLGPWPTATGIHGSISTSAAFLDFNGGRLTDFGHHWMDVVPHVLGERAPDSAVTAGGIYWNDDGKDAPTQCCLFEYPGFAVSFQSLSTGNPLPYGVTFYGDQGKLFVDRNRYVFTPPGKAPQIVTKSIPGDITTDHVRNFVDCCSRANRPTRRGIAAISIVPPLLAVKS